MLSDEQGSMEGGSTFLGRFARDTRGNTLAIMAASLVPLAGMIGGGLDISRMYIVKTRLQHACDAGALAGRKAMGGGTWEQSNYAPRTEAERFFDANYNNAAYGAKNVTREYDEEAGTVSGVASARLPMTLMRVLGKTEETLSVACDAEMRLPNTDVMFVLDVTGSMSSKAVSSDSQTKIEALRSSVKCFYEIVARENTTEVCSTGAPSGGLDSSVQVRFGFVPYDMNVNVGRLLKPVWFKDENTVQSREIVEIHGVPIAYEDPNDWSKPNWGSWSSNQYVTKNNQAECNSYFSPDEGDEQRGNLGAGKSEFDGGIQQNGRWKADQAWRDWERQYVSYNSSNKRCTFKVRYRNYTRSWTFQRSNSWASGATAFKAWRYKPVSFDVSALKNGNEWKTTLSMVAPVGNNYNTNTTVTWDGCIEERATVRDTSYYPIPDDALDLDLDSEPSSWDDRTRWAPAVNGLVYTRRENFSNSSDFAMDEITTFTNFSGKGYSCPTRARNLEEWSSVSDFEDYVDNMWGGGNTYHDIGLIWGARLMSPTGLFRARNEFTEGGGEIQRHMIFMTDGDACTENHNYQAYGISWWDRRQTNPAQVPTDGCTTTGTITQQVNARTQALCSAIKNKNITLWVIWFGASNKTLEGMLTTCATPTRFFTARNSAQLQQTFKSIADEISQLRLTR